MFEQCCYTHRLHIIKPNVKSGSRSVITDGSGHDVSWGMCVTVFEVSSA